MSDPNPNDAPHQNNSSSRPRPSAPVLSGAEGPHLPESAPALGEAEGFSDPSPIAPPPSPQWGGRRPGAGARKGNTNPLKHGAYSKQFAALGTAVAASPAARHALLRLLSRDAARGKKADELAAYILSQVLARGLKRGRQRGRTRLILLPPIDDPDSISKKSKTHARKRENHPETIKPQVQKRGIGQDLDTP